MRITCIIELSRSFERLETDPDQYLARPNHRPPGRSRRPRSIPLRRAVARAARTRSADHVRQKSEEPRALDRLRKLALLLGRHGRDPARHDLAALGDVTLQQLGVLVIDLRRIGAGERTSLAPPEERPSCAASATT